MPFLRCHLLFVGEIISLRRVNLIVAMSYKTFDTLSLSKPFPSILLPIIQYADIKFFSEVCKREKKWMRIELLQ